MIPKIESPIAERLKELDFLTETSIPKKVKKKKQLLSKGEVHIFEGEHIDKFATLKLKGLNIYGYEFGICYPKNRCYPIFIYQGIYVPKRALLTVSYPYYDLDSLEDLKGLRELLETDAELADKRLYKQVKPQYFLVDEVIENSYTGMIGSQEIDQGYEDVLTLFKKWYRGLENNIDLLPKETDQYNQWKNYFKDKFFAKDYGYAATKRYLGKQWTDTVFQQYLR